MALTPVEDPSAFGLVRLFDGTLKVPTRVRLMHSDAEHKVEEVGNQTLKRVPVPELSAGEVGYVLAGMKSLAGLAIGDTLTEADRPAAFDPARIAAPC